LFGLLGEVEPLLRQILVGALGFGITRRSGVLNALLGFGPISLGSRRHCTQRDISVD
jgi:hypothetical protein